MGAASTGDFVRFGNDVEHGQRVQAISGRLVPADRGRNERIGLCVARSCAALGTGKTAGVPELAPSGRQSSFVDGRRWTLSGDRKSTRLNSSHLGNSNAAFS